MARLTLESLMAPGGLLDAGSRLTQTLITVPYEREQFRTALQEKEIERTRASEREAKSDRVGYLKDRLNVNAQHVQRLRSAMASGDQNELRAVLAQMRQGRGASQSAWADQKAYESFLNRRENYEKDLLSRIGDVTKAGMARVSAEQIPAELERFTAQLLKEATTQGLYTPTKDAAPDVKLDMTQLFKKDSRLQEELDNRLDEEAQLLDQYRRLVGHAEDITAAKAAQVRVLDPAAMQPAAPAQAPEQPQVTHAPPKGPEARKALANAYSQLDPKNRPGLKEKLPEAPRPVLGQLAFDLSKRSEATSAPVSPTATLQQLLGHLNEAQRSELERRVQHYTSLPQAPSRRPNVVPYDDLMRLVSPPASPTATVDDLTNFIRTRLRPPQ